MLNNTAMMSCWCRLSANLTKSGPVIKSNNYPLFQLDIWNQLIIKTVKSLMIGWVYSFVTSFLDTLQWRHNGRDSVSNHQPRECLLSRLIRRRPEKTSKFRVTGLCAGNSPETGEFPAQRASNAENISIWWRHYYLREIVGKKNCVNAISSSATIRHSIARDFVSVEIRM